MRGCCSSRHRRRRRIVPPFRGTSPGVRPHWPLAPAVGLPRPSSTAPASFQDACSPPSVKTLKTASLPPGHATHTMVRLPASLPRWPQPARAPASRLTTSLRCSRLLLPALPPPSSRPPACSSRDAQKAWDRLDGLRFDGARWKVEWANRKDFGELLACRPSRAAGQSCTPKWHCLFSPST